MPETLEDKWLRRFERAIQSRLVWKYLTLVLALVLIGVFLAGHESDVAGVVGPQTTHPFSFDNIANGLFYSVVTSLIVSFFYDFFSRKDLQALVEVEREEQRRLLTDRFLGALDLDRIPDTEITELAQQVTTNQRMMECIATTLLGPQGRTFYHAWLRPLIDGQALTAVTVEHRLCRVDGRSDVYSMAVRQSFCAPSHKGRFVVLVTCDNDLYNDLITSDAVIDELVGTSAEEWSTIDSQLRSMSFRAWRVHEGKRDNIVIQPRTLRVGELTESFGRRVDSDLVRGFVFDLGPQEDWTYEVYYSVINRVSDPYYYWTAENPMFVDRLSFDYREVAHLIGRVSANCILGSTAGEPVHNADAGTYIVDVRSMVWPGQGGILVWRGNSEETGASDAAVQN